MSDSLRWRIPLILVLTVAAALVVVYGVYKPEAGLKFGFDLQGGVELVYRIEGSLTPEMAAKMAPEQIEEYKKNIASRTRIIIDVVSRRIDPTGVKAPDIRSEGAGLIILRLPGLTPDEVQSIKRRAEQMGRLEFRAIVPKEDYAKLTDEQKKTVKPMKMELKKRTPEQTAEYEELYVQTFDSFNITGEMLRQVREQFDQEQGLPAVAFKLNAEGAKRFYEFTKFLADRGARMERRERLAILLNGNLQSAPGVEHAIPGGSAQITGNFSETELKDLTSILQAGSLPAALTLQSESFVGPELGTDSRDRGYRACQIAMLTVVAFMLGYYLLAGAIADLALVFNLLFLVAAMMISKAVLTLPGIAGIVLTVGMAVDANVLIFERVREELQAGQTLRTAIKNGYERAFLTIFDSNLTTLITALALYYFGTGAVRGFAVTLSIGIIVSMFTALFITRAVFDFLIVRGWLKERLTMMRLLSKTRVRFVKWAPACVTVSMVCIIAGMTVFFLRGRDNYGIDFSSGTMINLRLRGFEVKVGEVASAGEGRSAFTVSFFDRRQGALVPAEVNDAVVADGLGPTRLKHLDEKLDASGVTFDWPEGSAHTTVRLVVPEPEGGTAKGKALAAFVAARGREVFRLHQDIEEVRKRVIAAGYPNADVQTSFGEATVGRRDSDQFTFRVAGASDNETQEAREAVPMNIEQAFADIVDRKPVGTEVNVETVPSPDNAAKPLNRVTLRFVQFDPELNRNVPSGLRRVHIESSLRELGFGGATMHWPGGEPRRYYDEITFDVPNGDKEAISAKLLAPGAVTIPDAFTGYYFVNPGQAKSIVWSAILASILSFVGICIYVWVRFHGFKYGIAAVAALVHDVLFTLGLLAVFAWMSEKPWGSWIGDVRLSLDVVAGILTLIGYSINDTIVVFDRIRENLRRRVREMRGRRQGGEVLTPELIDAAINQTLSRTTLTSFTTWIVCVVLFVAGGAKLAGLSLCLIIGVVVGTYSSIAIASPILVLTHAWEARRARATGGMTTEEKEVAEEERAASKSK